MESGKCPRCGSEDIMTSIFGRSKLNFHIQDRNRAVLQGTSIYAIIFYAVVDAVKNF